MNAKFKHFKFNKSKEADSIFDFTFTCDFNLDQHQIDELLPKKILSILHELGYNTTNIRLKITSLKDLSEHGDERKTFMGVCLARGLE